MVLLLPMQTSFLNVSGEIYDSEFLNLVQLSQGKIQFDERTLFLNESEKKVLNQQPIVEINQAVYVFHHNGRWGIIANLPKEEYSNGKVKSHELVLPNTIQGMLSNFHGYNGEAAPVLLGHKEHIALDEFVKEYKPDQQYQLGDFDLFVYQGEHTTSLLANYSNLKQLFIGDGHHRLYSTSLSNFKSTVLACVMCFDYLDIFPIHRVLKNISEASFKQSLQFLDKKFEVTKANKNDKFLKGYVKLTRGEESYLVRLIDLDSDAFWNNDVYRMNTQIISQAFRTYDQEEIQYISEQDLQVGKVFGKEDVILETHALSKQEFIEAAQNDTVLPPKSTWIYPKFPSFLVMNKYQ